jgi:anti-sigma regulatory factor (Ser/Thr protein kinase)
MEMAYQVDGGDFVQAGSASSGIKRAMQQIGLRPEVIRRVAVAAYEAEMNIVIHAERGIMRVLLWVDCVEVVAQDEGPGIPDIELAMQEGYSTAPEWVRSLGFGAGMGLPNIRKSCDDMKIATELGKGTTVTMRISR